MGKSREAREAARQLSRLGHSNRVINGGEAGIGSVTRFVVGMVPNAEVVTIEQQPGDLPRAYKNPTVYKEDWLRRGYEDLGIRATGASQPISLETVRVLVQFAYANDLLPGGEAVLQAVQEHQ